jgi:predicted glycosyltransferase
MTKNTPQGKTHHCIVDNNARVEIAREVRKHFDSVLIFGEDSIMERSVVSFVHSEITRAIQEERARLLGEVEKLSDFNKSASPQSREEDIDERAFEAALYYVRELLARPITSGKNEG